jgi:quercetin dioxygenase-like cupin family protein
MPSFLRCRSILALTAVCLSAVLTGNRALGQALTGEVCKPVSARTGELGCWIMADEAMGPLSKSEAFWHLDTYPTSEAATAAKGARGTVIHALGKDWLLSIEEATWQPPAGGEHVATVGPLPIGAAEKYSAQYMEAIFTPGMTATVHNHPGPEAFYTVSGETCLETSEGVSIGRPGGPAVIVPGGLPMQLVATGTETRRAVVLILHDSSKPAGHFVHDWTPKGLCKK